MHIHIDTFPLMASHPTSPVVQKINIFTCSSWSKIFNLLEISVEKCRDIPGC